MKVVSTRQTQHSDTFTLSTSRTPVVPAKPLLDSFTPAVQIAALTAETPATTLLSADYLDSLSRPIVPNGNAS